MRDELLGKEYVVPAYIDLHVNYSLAFGNPQNKTVTVNIEFPTVDDYSRKLCKNQTNVLIIPAFQFKILELQCDIIGTHVKASENVIVYSATIKEEVGGIPDLLMIEQLIPVRLWGTYYVVVPSGKSPEGDRILVITAHENTTVHILGHDHVTIQGKYDRIQRRILGTSPITIKSSKPVTVTQFVVRSDDTSMINIIPLKYKIDKSDLMKNDSLSYTYIQGEKEDGTNISLSKYHAYSGRKFPKLPEFILSCTLLHKESELLPRSNCGFMDESQTEDIWPVMVPGDGIDNDGDNQIDEDDCCQSDLFGTLFVIPVIPLNTYTVLNTYLKCSVSGQDEISVRFSKYPTINWSPLSVPRIDNIFEIKNLTRDPLIVKSNNEKEILLSCQYMCDSGTQCSNKFIVPPVDILQTEYFATIPLTPIPETVSQKGCLVAGIFDNTKFTYLENTQILTLQKGKQQAIQLLTVNGTFITSSHIISVLCFIKYKADTSEHYLINHVLPISGTRFNIKTSDNLSEEKLVLISTDENTVLNLTSINHANSENVFNEYRLIQKGGQMENLDWENTSNLEFRVISSKPIIVMASFERKNQDGSHSSGYDFVHVAPDPNTDSEVHVYRSLDRTESDLSKFTITERIYPFTSHQIPGDGEDNDRDGLIDEEYCGFLWGDEVLVDYDLDGALNEDCKGCPEGKELLSTFICEFCEIGTYRENSSRIDKCEQCGMNMTTYNNASTSQTDCIPICEEGMELKNVTEKCEPCPFGYYKTVSANDTSLRVSDRFWCKKCPAEKTTNDTGSTSIKDCIAICEEGMELENRIENCEPCPVGYYKNVSANDTSLSVSDRFWCKKCPPEKTTYEIRATHCIDICVEGTEFENITEKCIPCPVGFYKNVSANDTSHDSSDRFRCKKCPDGETTYETGASHCIAICEEGKELENGTDICVPCRVGFYKNVSANDTNLHVSDRFWCKKCPVKKTTYDRGATYCIDICEKGMELENGTEKCKPCPVGYYKNVSANDTSLHVSDRFWCKKCPAENTTYESGTSSIKDCIAHCKEGMYYKDDRCTECEIGFFKNTSSENITLKKNLRWNCTKCLPGTTTLSKGGDKCIELCSTGKEYDAITDKCYPCKLGFFKNISGSNINCSSCPNNYTTGHLGAISEEQCKRGKVILN
ncbi:uncharacterized protein LOC134253516 [Saccostrea cucullata]|uniref:uncharacterized protein LOC134253516 n=1 Tax=Saccostrea cuccullata TaxID=36930 RepID=UPI002ED69863